MEKERRSQTMKITVGEYEDILSQLSDLASRVEYIEDNMAYRYCSEDEQNNRNINHLLTNLKNTSHEQSNFEYRNPEC